METLEIESRRQRIRANGHPLRKSPAWANYKKAEQRFNEADKALEAAENKIDSLQRELSELAAPVSDHGKSKLDLLSMFHGKQKRKAAINVEIEKLLSDAPELQSAKIAALQGLELSKNDVLTVAKRLHSDIVSDLQRHLDDLKANMKQALALRQSAPGFEIPLHFPINELINRIQQHLDALKRF